MENKINVAELLRKCPEGMELDCTLFSKPLKYSGLECPRDIFPIRTVADNGEIFWFTKEGCIHNNMYSKCVIFPKGKTSWEGFAPPYPFKDGDICYIKTNGNEHIFIFNCIDNYGIKRYANLTKHGFYKDNVNIVCTEKVIEEFRYATEEEKDRLFKSIKDHGYQWNPEKKCLEKLPKFKDGDIVAYDNVSSPSTVFIYRNYNPDWNTSYFVGLSGLTGKFYKDASGALNGYNPNVRFATKEEKERLFKAIKDNGYTWNTETKTLESIIKPKFKVGDKIRNKLTLSCFIIEEIKDNCLSTSSF